MRTLAALAFAAVAACGTSPSGGDDVDDPIVPTPIGMPIGDPATATLGADGGTLVSPDGGLTITVPPGALAADTAVTIQPITDTSYSPVGKTPVAYRLSPGDLQFAQPVTLAFAYADADLVADTPDPMVLAVQDAAGFWFANTPAIDTTAHTVSIDVTTFGLPDTKRTFRDKPKPNDWSKQWGFRLDPVEQDVKIKTGEAFPKIVFCVRADNDDDRYDYREMTGCRPVQGAGAAYVADQWAVFGEIGGDLHVGKIVGDQTGASYHAPDEMPDPSDFDITVRVKYTAGGVEKQAVLHDTIHLVCRLGFIAGGANQCTSPKFVGTSHVVDLSGAVYDNTFTFELDPSSPDNPTYIVTSGQVNITTQPPFAGDCTTTIEASHAIGPHDGMLAVDDTDLDNPKVTGMGTTVWLATYTQVCPDGTTTTMQLPYSIAWWPLAPGAPQQVTLPNGMATFTASNQQDTATIMLSDANAGS